MNVDSVLAPVDGSDHADRSAAYAVALAARYDATLYLLHVLDETTVRGMEEGTVDPDAIAADQRAVTETIREQLAEAGHDGRLEQSSAAGFSPTRLRQSPGSVILDVAEDNDADFIVVPREPGSDEPTEAIGRAALYVVQYASQPVLSV
jgi:nucleotide-binding universal stress UspA family protein